MAPELGPGAPEQRADDGPEVGRSVAELRWNLVGPTHHNTNLESLVTGPRIVLAEQHAKGRRDGYAERERARRA